MRTDNTKIHNQPNLILRLCLVGIHVVPFAAAPGSAYQLNAVLTDSTVPQVMFDDLWSVYMNYRLSQFDLNVQQTTDVIGVLCRDQHRTVSLNVTPRRTSQKGRRSDLPFQRRTRMPAKGENLELINLWKEISKNKKNRTKSRYSPVKRVVSPWPAPPRPLYHHSYSP